METLQTLYEKPPSTSNFVPRKYNIKHPKTLLLGSKKSGISSIIIDFLSTKEIKNYLYINLDDIRLNGYDFKKIPTFLEQKNIQTLVIENYKANFILPNIKNIILSSNDLSLKLQGFNLLRVDGLNFEEFIGFSQRSFNTEHIFNIYAKIGTFPKSSQLNSYENRQYLQEIIKLNLRDEISQKLFCTLAKHQAQPYSLFKAYSELKTNMKISKDKLYKSAVELEKKSLLSFVEKFSSPRSCKKIYLHNFAFKNSVSLERDFTKRFENMIFSQILHEQLYYTDELHFYLPNANLALLATPFLPPELIVRRFKKLLLNLKKLNVTHFQAITLGNEGAYSQDGIKCEIVPFWEWAVLL